ncbi:MULTISPECIES: glucose-1-phosphate thymidylyltransferase [unclassified Streptomyces]|uniref:glucose-1-phosphate thymidylyltransferase n=1 Tax=unclassified Streptomyces TaxID=2593676 RepID=UPI0008E48D0D|nr:glucose-1-phosphate thymidylyltransferase [Streptomyces sp. ok210]SFS89205.1 glucose-1-phosphate thymidylyltransferase [Streptomyces sp. ok210]
MKALVLSGGSGTRLRPFTHTSAEQLLLVANRPVLFHGLDAIADAGITDVGIVVGETADEIRHAVGDGSRFGLDITYIPQGEPLGLAHAVLVSREFLGDEDFVMYLGDNIVVGGITEFVDAFRVDRPEARILLTRMPDPTAFGVAELDGSGAVVRLEEKPARPRSDLALVGVYLFSPAVHEAVRSIAPSRHGELEITHAIQWLIDHGRDVRATTISGYWKDTGDVSDMLEANRAVLEGLRPCIAGEVDTASEIAGRVAIAESARVHGSRIVGPAIIGPDAIVSGSSIGPFTSIAEGCRIEDSEIEFSIVLPGASIRGVHGVEASVIGRDAEVSPAPAFRRAHRLVLGDHSKVQISSWSPPRSW